MQQFQNIAMIEYVLILAESWLHEGKKVLTCERKQNTLPTPWLNDSWENFSWKGRG